MEKMEPPRRQRTVSCVGLCWQSEVSLKTTIGWLQGKTQESWTYTEEANADVIVYDPANALAQTMARRSTEGHDSQVFVCANSDSESELSIRFPTSPSHLIECLDRASSQLASKPGNVSRIDRASLCQRLDDAIHTPGAVAVEIASGCDSGVYRIHEHQLLWPRPLDLEEIAALMAAEIEVRPLTVEDAGHLNEIIAASTTRVPSDTFLWAVGSNRSGGEMMKRVDPAQKCRLKRYPNFGVLGYSKSDMRCASILMQREVTPQELSLISGLPITVVGEFINAASLCGILKAGGIYPSSVSKPREEMHPVSSRLGNMFRSLRSAFELN